MNAAQHTQIPPVVAGFDGFVDTILHVVSERHSPAEYTRLLTLEEFAQTLLKQEVLERAEIERIMGHLAVAPLKPAEPGPARIAAAEPPSES